MSVIIADDQERERTWLKKLVEKSYPELTPIFEVQSGEEAVELARDRSPSLVLLDIEMRGMSGIKAAELIVGERPETAVVIVTNHSDEVWVRQLWKVMPANGSFAYVLKDSSDSQIMEALDAVVGGDCYIHPRVQRVVRRISNTATGLSDAEFEVLAYISLGLTDRAIGKALYITEKAVQARLKGLYTKFEIPLKGSTSGDDFNHRCRAINIAFRRGLLNRPELEEWETRLESVS